MAAERYEAKRAALRAALAGNDGILVGFSGGVDSTALLAAAMADHEGRVLAVTVSSPLSAESEAAAAVDIARRLGAEHRIIEIDQLADPDVAANPPRRCYYCKRQIFGALKEIAAREGLAQVMDGGNLDDLADYRPGQQALAELSVRSPLREAGLTKDDVRALARDAGMPNWDAPATACLGSRIPYGEALTRARLDRVGRAEAHLRAAGFTQLRVRDHGELARIEVPAGDVERLASLEVRAPLVDALKALGYTWVSLDLTGYRAGAMNEALPQREPPGGARTR